MSVNADPDTAKRRLAFRKSYSQEHGGGWHRRSLIEDAKFDTVANAEFEKQEQNTAVTDHVIIKENKEENGQTNGHTDETNVFNRTVILNLRDTSALSRVFRNFENCGASVQHVESRKSQKNVSHTDVMVNFLATRDAGHSLMKSLRQSSAIQDVTVLPETKPAKKIWFPRHISDLDKCQHLLTMYDPDLDQKHPGFSDLEYRARRKEIADIAFLYRHGQQIPNAEYSDDEIKTWSHSYRQIKALLPTHACKQYIDNFKILEKEGVYSEHTIPQLNDVSNFLKRTSGFQLRPVAGLLSARDFLASLAFRVFQCTQYVRHPSNPDHTVEPDCIHELIGHVPMLADPSFAQFSQEIGLASLGASDDDIEKFATLYWFSVEFGLCKQAGETRAYGAALMSSYGELKYSLSDEPEVRPFNPPTTALQEYQDQDFQPIYYITESFEGMKEQMRRYAASIPRPYEVRYDPYTQSIQILDGQDIIQDITHVLKGELNCLCNAVSRIQVSM